MIQQFGIAPERTVPAGNQSVDERDLRSARSCMLLEVFKKQAPVVALLESTRDALDTNERMRDPGTVERVDEAGCTR